LALAAGLPDSCWIRRLCRNHVARSYRRYV
jgi:hypothetical protein